MYLVEDLDRPGVIYTVNPSRQFLLAESVARLAGRYRFWTYDGVAKVNDPLPPSPPCRRFYGEGVPVVDASGTVAIQTMLTAGGMQAVGVPGPAGKDGRDGTNGKDGANGTNGSAGTPGAPGTPKRIETYTTGATGQNGQVTFSFPKAFVATPVCLPVMGVDSALTETEAKVLSVSAERVTFQAYRRLLGTSLAVAPAGLTVSFVAFGD